MLGKELCMKKLNFVSQNWRKGKQFTSTCSKYSKTYVKRPLKSIDKTKILMTKRYLNEGLKYCRMLPMEHSAIH